MELLMERHGHLELETHKMKTSAAQFRILVDFMEEHGDFSKPSPMAYDRIAKNEAWAKLAEALNAVADFNGQSRSVEKWKKVWSDMKTNTKRKALKLVRKPADCQLRLTQLEYRLLKIMNMIKTTPLTPPSSSPGALPAPATLAARALALVPGLASPARASASPPPPQHEHVELMFENAFERKLPCSRPASDGVKAEHNNAAELDDEFSWPKSPSPEPQQRLPLENCIELEDCTVVTDCMMAVDCTLADDCTMPASEAPPETPPAPPRPDSRGHTTARGRGPGGGGGGGGARRLERLAGALLRGEAARRREARVRSLRDAALQRERLRLRARELNVQHKWQTICERGLDLMERFVSQQGSARGNGPMRAQAPMEVPEDLERWTAVPVLLPRPLARPPDRDQWAT